MRCTKNSALDKTIADRQTDGKTKVYLVGIPKHGKYMLAKRFIYSISILIYTQWSSR